jgi:hypothetical protein
MESHVKKTIKKKRKKLSKLRRNIQGKEAPGAVKARPKVFGWFAIWAYDLVSKLNLRDWANPTTFS